MSVNHAAQLVVADLLSQRTGQQLTEGRQWRIGSALAGLFRERGISNLDQLVCLLDDPRETQLATEVVEALINNETYFFRDHAYFQTLSQHVLPELMRKREATRRISIWSAGCSTGQEVLSLAMMFAEQPARWTGWDISILGTDVSGKAIKLARSGVYSQFEIQRGISVAQMLQFFTETRGGWQASDKIRAMAQFREANILDAPPQPRNFDLVMCRNVLLYFDPPTRRRAFDRLAEGCAADGWLMLGAGETVVGQTERFVPAPCGAALYNLAPAPGTLAAGAGRSPAFAGR